MGGAGGCGEEEWEVSVYVWDEEKVLELDGDDGCATI